MKLKLNRQIVFTIASLLLLAVVSSHADIQTRSRKSASTQMSNQKEDQKADQKVNIEQDLETLGGNEVLIKKAQALDPDNKLRIVQKRLVDRHMRFELGLNLGGVFGGDSYVDSKVVGGQAEFHFTPHWSVGLRHQVYGNKLSNEGQRVYDANANQPNDVPYSTPGSVYPINTTLALVSWYPIYGKANIFDAGISQFDLYLTGGAGQINLSSGSTNTWTAGGGIGFWLSQHISARAELRYQNYHDQISSGPRNIDTVVGQIGLGLLL